MVNQPSAGTVDQSVSVTVRLRIKKALAVKRPALEKNSPCLVFRSKFNPAFIEITLLGNQAMSDLGVLNNQVNCYHVARRNGKVPQAQRSNFFSFAAMFPGKCKEIHCDRITQKLPYCFKL